MKQTVINLIQNKSDNTHPNLLKIFALIICTFFSMIAFNQVDILNYKVMHGSSEIGWLKLQKTDSGTKTFITFNSIAKKRMIISFEITDQESATFYNGVMTESSVFRKVNTDVKVNKHTVNKGSYYEVNEKEATAMVKINGIEYNQLSMYFKEPENIKQVYSDTFQQLLKIEPLGTILIK